MVFDPRAVEASIALNLISSTEMPKMAREALEAGLDGPALRRIAAFEFPTFFQIREVLPRAMDEMHIAKLSKGAAALQLAKLRAQEILAKSSDPRDHLRDFENWWIAADHCRELDSYGNLIDDVDIAQQTGQSEKEIRAWLMDLMRTLAAN